MAFMTNPPHNDNSKNSIYSLLNWFEQEWSGGDTTKQSGYCIWLQSVIRAVHRWFKMIRASLETGNGGLPIFLSNKGNPFRLSDRLTWKPENK